MNYFRFERPRRFIGRPLRYCLILAFLIAAILVGGSVAEASEKKPPQEQSLDPNLWFDNVEVVAAQEIGRETVPYVGNIYKYYTAYRLVYSQLEKKEQLRKKKK